LVQLSRYFEAKYATGTEQALLLRSATAAGEFQAFLQARDVPARILNYQLPKVRRGAEVHVVFYPSASFPLAKQFWQHTGLGITTRLADYYISLLDVAGDESVFDSRSVEDFGAHELGDGLTAAAATAKVEIQRRLADLTDTEIECVWLYPSGMHAIWSAHQVCMATFGSRKSVCFG
jgi:cystathionine gamma-synthase